MSAPLEAAFPPLDDASDAHNLGNRFLVSVIAFLRSKQLSNGAPARVARDGHTPTYTAVLEVLANTISWSRVNP